MDLNSNPAKVLTMSNFWRQMTGRKPHESGGIHLKVTPNFPHQDEIEKTSQRGKGNFQQS